MKYLFALEKKVDDDFNVVVNVDCFYHIKSYDYLTNTRQTNPQYYYTTLVTLMGKDNVEEKYPNFEQTIHTDAQRMQSMELRARYNDLTMHLVETDYELDIDIMQEFINSKVESGEIKTFMEESKAF